MMCCSLYLIRIRYGTNQARLIGVWVALWISLLPSLALSSPFYNLTEYTVDLASRVSLPASWQPNPGPVNYTGSLDAYWLARLANDHDTVEIARQNALSLGLPANFSLVTTPDNCWGMDMGFGLVTLAQAANLSVTVVADNSAIIPAFALYRGWDTSKTASRHRTIFFGTHNPLGTQGLTYLGEGIGTQAGGSINKTFSNLPAGNYEIFVTVGTNQSAGGHYKVTLVTTPSGGGLQAPGAPTGVTATSGNGKAYVNWTPPISNGGAAITGYMATSNPDGKTCSAPIPGCEVTGLANGTAYTFTVTASNAVGTSAPSTQSSAVTPAAPTVPGSPTNVLASAGDGQAFINWSAPANNGGAAITGYTATSEPAGKTCGNLALGCTIGGLNNGTSYTFRVSATNAAGTGLLSAPSNAIIPSAAPTVPSAPTAVVAWPGDQSALVSWTAPVSNGGSAISGYRVVTTPGDAVCTVNKTQCTVTGLTNGSPYRFAVTATNASGDSLPSAPSKPVIPATPVSTDRLAYNLNASGDLPPVWNQRPTSFNYAGNLPVYWWARMATDQETIQLSRAEAARNGAGEQFDLLTASPNTTGAAMNFGLLRLDAPANLDITLSADASQGSQLIPGIALYRGWTTSANSDRNQRLTLGDNHPLGTQNLIYLGQALAESRGGTAHLAARQLPPGDYTVFVTVGKNDSPKGSYQLTLSTTPPPANGRCGIAANQLSPVKPAESDLCAAGNPAQLRRLAKSRYEWLCTADTPESTGERCYTVAKDGRLNQAPLTLQPGNVEVTSGESVTQNAVGGSGTGQWAFAKKSSTPGSRCSLQVIKNQVEIKTSGKAGQCAVTASKAPSKGFNKVESYPAVVNIRP
jgi:hypothetical protein